MIVVDNVSRYTDGLFQITEKQVRPLRDSALSVESLRTWIDGIEGSLWAIQER